MLRCYGEKTRAVCIREVQNSIKDSVRQLIVDKIETEREVVDVLDLNVELGQGYLFGEPKPVREEVTRATAEAVSAAA